MVSKVIIVIFGVLLLVALAGFLLLRAPTTTPPPPIIKLKVRSISSNSNNTENSSDFLAGEPILEIQHVGGEPIYWSNYRMLLYKEGVNMSYPCSIISINNVPFPEEDKTVSGDSLFIGIDDGMDGVFYVGDLVFLRIIHADRTVYQTTYPIKL